jgi:hypothetical protein
MQMMKKTQQNKGMWSSGKANVFVSHAQMELLQFTVTAIRLWRNRNNSRVNHFWLDYFTLRQNAKGEFNPECVSRIICDIKKTVLVCTRDRAVFGRLWCIYEVACTVEEQLKVPIHDSHAYLHFSYPFQISWSSREIEQTAAEVDVSQAESSDKAAQGRIMELIGCGPGLRKTNEAVREAVRKELLAK